MEEDLKEKSEGGYSRHVLGKVIIIDKSDKI
jgi:hypothetical protein